MRHEFRSISPENAHSVMGAGEPNSGGVAYALMEGDFSYNVSGWKPNSNGAYGNSDVILKVEGGVGWIYLEVV